MLTYSLKFIDQAEELKFQDKEHKKRIRLLRLYQIIKICSAIIEIIIHWSHSDSIVDYKQGFVVLGTFSGYFLIFLNKSVKVSMMANFMQVVTPIVSMFTNGSWSLALNPPKDNLFMYGGFKAINMATLYFLGTNYISNSACFIFAASFTTYYYFPPTLTYNAINFMAASVWLIVLKYISDKDRRGQYLLKLKDEYWTYVMKDMINDWVIVLTHDTQRDQIIVRDANQNFKKSCQIYDDKNFRTFARTIHVEVSNDKYGSLNHHAIQQIIQSQQIENIYKESEVKKLPNLEHVLRNNLIKKDNLIVEQKQQKRRISFRWNKNIKHVQVEKFIGVQIDITRNKFKVFSIRLIKGSDTEAFLLLIIKQIKTRSLTKQQPKCLVMKNNLLRMSSSCAQFLKISEFIHNNAQQYCISKNLTAKSEILSVTNSNFTHQLYLNQMHNISQFKFDSTISSINIHHMIRSLQQLKRSQIKIIFVKDNYHDIIIQSFYRELTHLFLIFIENTIKHSKLIQPVVKIQLTEEEQGILRVKFQDFGQGMSVTLIQQFLDSYKINISRKQKIEILNLQNFNLHIRQEMRYGWVAAKLLLSLLSPICSFTIYSIENEGSSITFFLYKDISHIIKLRKIS